MNLAPMRYKDYVWPHNPETYTISFKRQVAVAKVPFGRYGMQDLGMSYRVMEGEGVFAGKGAYDEFKKLASVFYQGGPGLLIHPVWQASQAYFVLLELAQQPLENYVRYRFAFWETSPLDTSLIRVSGGSGNAGTRTKTATGPALMPNLPRPSPRSWVWKPNLWKSTGTTSSLSWSPRPLTASGTA